MNILRSFLWSRQYEELMKVRSLKFTVVESALDCSKLALRHEGHIYSALLYEQDKALSDMPVILCCKSHSSFRGMAIVLFIRIDGETIDIHCSAHKRQLVGYSEKSHIFSAYDVEDKIAELQKYALMIRQTIANLRIDDMQEFTNAINVVRSIVSRLAFPPYNQ